MRCVKQAACAGIVDT
jgi:hypothetical protein